MGAGKRSRWRWLLVLAVAIAIIAATHSIWLPELGYCLVSDEPPEKADLIIMLAGDSVGNRVLRAAELVRQGYAPKALLSSPMELYGVPEGDLALAFGVKHGYAKELFEVYPIRARSTNEEAGELLAEARRRGLRRLLVVTSNFHTARARRIFARKRGEIAVRVTAAQDRDFRPADWWRSREARKTWLVESTKTVADFLGL